MKVQIVQQKIIGNVAIADGFYDLKKYVKQRTNPQNRYLHGCVLPLIAKRMSEMSGKNITPALAKEIIKYKFLTVKIPNVGTIVKPTSKLTTVEWDEFILKIQEYSARVLEIYVPDPGQEGYN